MADKLGNCIKYQQNTERHDKRITL